MNSKTGPEAGRPERQVNWVRPSMFGDQILAKSPEQNAHARFVLFLSLDRCKRARPCVRGLSPSLFLDYPLLYRGGIPDEGKAATKAAHAKDQSQIPRDPHNLL